MHPRHFLFFVWFLLGWNACLYDTPSSKQTDSNAATEKPQDASSKWSSSLEELSPAEANSFESLVADYESKDRIIWQKPDLVISLLGDIKDKTVADIGAGTGYFAFRLVPVAGKVIAVDIDPRFISFMDSVVSRLPEEYRRRFETRLAKPHDPMLSAEEADAVIIVNTYGYLQQRVAYLKTLLAGMKPKATLLIIDFKKNSLPIGPSSEFKVALAEVVRELEAAGFQSVKVDRVSLDYQYIVIAQKP